MGANWVHWDDLAPLGVIPSAGLPALLWGASPPFPALLQGPAPGGSGKVHAQVSSEEQPCSVLPVCVD